MRKLSLIAAFSLLLVGSAPLHAQDALDAGVNTDATAEQAEPSTRPPRVVHAPPVDWPESEARPESGFVEVLIVISSEGSATLSECSLPEAACLAVATALEQARFEPALLDGVPQAARVGLRLFLASASPVEAADDTTSEATSASDAGTPQGETPAPLQATEYGAEAQIQRPEPTAHIVSLEQLRELPGAFGDPYRVIDALPGVVPVMTGMPYVYVRGAPPAATAYYYDDIVMPALFHLGLGPAVVHPAMVGDIDFYPGVAPARYGRKTGGVVTGKGALRPLKEGLHGELELRLVDAQVYLAKPFARGGRIEVAGRYGYPGPAIKLFESSAVVQYWDYQLRSIVPLSSRTEASLVVLGSFDFIGSRSNGRLKRQLELQFHRLEARVEQRRDNLTFGGALSAGFERSGLEDTMDITAYRMGPRVWLERNLRSAKLRLGADMTATLGRLENPLSDPDDPTDAFRQNPIYRSARHRDVVGAYSELRFPLLDKLEFDLGLRSDMWVTGGDVQWAIEPRGVARYFARDDLTLHIASGLAYQPAVFLIPLPGIADTALDRGLQRAVQSEIGAKLELPASFSLEAKAFWHVYDRMLSFEAIEDGDVTCNVAPIPAPSDGTPPTVQDEIVCEETEGFARLSAQAFGSEWMLRRDYREALSGWLSYTLSKASARSESGRAFTPNFDVRHVANLILQWRIGPRWRISLRGFAQSGRHALDSATSADPRRRKRLPAFYRGDLQISRVWPKRWGELRFSFDWLNFTFRREPLGWDCYEPTGACSVSYVEFPVTLPMLGVRGSF